MLTITTTSERTGRWTKMHRPFVPFSVTESSTHTRSSADCITTTFGVRFSVHTRAIFCIGLFRNVAWHVSVHQLPDQTESIDLVIVSGLRKASTRHLCCQMSA